MGGKKPWQQIGFQYEHQATAFRRTSECTASYEVKPCSSNCSHFRKRETEGLAQQVVSLERWMISVCHLLSDGRRESKASDDSFLLSAWVMLSMRSTHISIILPNNWSIWWGDVDNVEDRWARGRRRKKEKTDRGDLKYSGVSGEM